MEILKNQGMSDAKRLVIDTHTHIFCWGENPEQGYLSRKTPGAWLTRLVLA